MKLLEKISSNKNQASDQASECFAAFHFVVQVDTNVVLPFLLTECQER